MRFTLNDLYWISIHTNRERGIGSIMGVWEVCHLYDSDELMEIQETECHISTFVNTLTVNSNRLTAITQAQANDPVCNILIFYCSAGWPVKSSLPDSMKPYRKYQGELSVHDNLLLYQNRLVIPKQQQQQGLQKLHNSHQGIQCCHLRAKSLVRWLHIRSDIDSFIKQCHVCQNLQC